MASGKGNTWIQDILNLICGAVAFSAPGTSYVALYTVAPTASGGGTEATSGSYARASNTNNTTTWPSISSSTTTMQNGVAFTFPTATADWSSASNMVAAALLSASGGGTLFYFGSLTESKPVLNGDTAQFAVNAIQITES